MAGLAAARRVPRTRQLPDVGSYPAADGTLEGLIETASPGRLTWRDER
jgi:hypothetical protein